MTGTLTIEEIEAQAERVTEAERDAMRRLAVFLREIAVELPAESKAPVRLAKVAKSIDLYTTGTEPALWSCCTVEEIVREYGVDAVDEYIAKLEQAKRRFG